MASFLTGGFAAVCCAVASIVFATGAVADSTVSADEIHRILTQESQRRDFASIDLDIQFEFDSSTLTADAKHQLDELASALWSMNLTGSAFQVVGHTDATGSEDYNVALSLQRAKSVRRYLVARHGIPADRVEAVGMGQQRLRNPFDPENPNNRRVEVIVGTNADDVLTGTDRSMQLQSLD